MNEVSTFSGFVALIGRPNVGKSTFLNAILKQKISITSRKPQTTRHQILGILTEPSHQIIFIDTPGIHSKTQKALNRYMNKAARSVITEVDLVLHFVDVTVWTEEDEKISELLSKVKVPKFLVQNKIDLISKQKLAEVVSRLSANYEYEEYIPLSAKKQTNLDKMLDLIRNKMPALPFLYPIDQITDKSLIFQLSESIREKLMHYLHKEIPYSLTVQIEKYEETDTMDTGHAIIWVERESQKGIVIGKQGENLKKVGESVRKEFETRIDKKFNLQLWVKVKEGWADKDHLLKSLGYFD